MSQPAAIPNALLAVFAVLFFFGLCGLVASAVAAFRRWLYMRKLGR